MNKIICELEQKGMSFNKKCDIESASKYLTYNVTWISLQNSLKQFSKLIEDNKLKTKKEYEGLFFYDVIQAGLLDFYYNDMIRNTLNEFEHLLKNYFVEVFDSLNKREQEKIIVFINFMVEKERFLNKCFEIKDIYELFIFVTFSELIDIFNNLLFQYQTIIPYQIPQSFAVFFKEAIYNKGVTLFMEKDNKIIFKNASFTFNALTDEQIKYLEVNPYNNSCFLALQLIKLTGALYDRTDSLEIRKSYTKDALVKGVSLCNTSLSKSSVFDQWVHSHFQLIDRVVNESFM